MTITLTREEAQQVLDAFLGIGQRAYDAMSGDAFHECSIAVSRLRARLAQETPYEIGQRLYREGKGISVIPTAVERDDQIGEALHGFEDARLAQPEPEPIAYKVGDATVYIKPPIYTAPPQPEPEPVAWLHSFTGYGWQVVPEKLYPTDQPLYTAPPQRKEWQGLTDEEAAELCHAPIAAIESKLREKNT
jgi:hypothetical protein